MARILAGCMFLAMLPEAYGGKKLLGNFDIETWLQPHKTRCESLRIPMCKDMPYNQTVVPNHFKHMTQDEADSMLRHFEPLVKFKCSAYIKDFLCFLYAPVCTILEKPFLPCRSFCRKAKKGCLEFLRKYGYSWPEVLKCKHFPKSGGDEICIDHKAAKGKSTNRRNAKKE